MTEQMPWAEFTSLALKENEGRTLKRGMRVIDWWGETGIVVKIIPGVDTEDHGTVYVWRDSEMYYGADNCEHYVEFGWQRNLRILEEP